MKTLLKLCIVLLLLSISACMSAPEATTEPTPDASPKASLRNTLWKLVELDGKPVRSRDDQRMASLTLSQEEPQARIATACNRGSATFTLAGSSLKFGAAAATKMMCPAEQMQEEASFFKAIENTARYEITGESLQLFDANNQLLAAFHSEYL